jgi:geranylgeranyl reductase family protein
MQATDHKLYDVAIIGAGPAGSAAALGFGSSGLKVALIDKDEFPREKTCGDAIPGPAVKALSSAFPFFDDEFKKLKARQRITASRIMLQNGRSIDYQWTLPAYNIKRSIFDKFLIDLIKKYTNTNSITGVKVEDISEGTPHLIKTAQGNLTTRLLIFCDGSNSLSQNIIQNPTPKTQNAVFAVRSYYKGINLNTTTNFFYINKKHLPGYFWIFPLPSGEFNVGFGMKTGRDGKVKINMNEALTDFAHAENMRDVFASSNQLSAPSGAFIPVGGKKQSYSGDGYLVAGDAANLADPLQGHGIDKAIVSGLLAARQAMKAFKYNDLSGDFLFEYNTLIAAGIERELKKNYRKMMLLSSFPFLLNLAVIKAS